MPVSPLRASLCRGRRLTRKSYSAADRAFIMKVSQGGARSFAGRRQAPEHSTRLGISFPRQLNAMFGARLDKLSSLSGKAFDDTVIEETKTIHAADGAAFAARIRAGDRADREAAYRRTGRLAASDQAGRRAARGCWRRRRRWGRSGHRRQRRLAAASPNRRLPCARTRSAAACFQRNPPRSATTQSSRNERGSRRS